MESAGQQRVDPVWAGVLELETGEMHSTMQFQVRAGIAGTETCMGTVRSAMQKVN